MTTGTLRMYQIKEKVRVKPSALLFWDHSIVIYCLNSNKGAGDNISPPYLQLAGEENHQMYPSVQNGLKYKKINKELINSLGR